MPDFASICFLSYNRPQFLVQCIDSAVANAGMPVEVVVHDDGSDDPDLHRSLTWMLRDGKISHLILNPPGHNEGVGAAVHRSFAIASGDPVVKMDQDLVDFRPGWLAKCKDWLDHDIRAGMFGLFRYYVDPVDWRKMNHRAPGRVVNYVNDEDELPTETEATGYEYVDDFVGSAMVIPRRVLDELGLFDRYSTSFGEDYVYKQHRLRPAGYELALPIEDLARNVGFGPPFSTVVSFRDGIPGGEIDVAEIHDAPYLLARS